MATVPWLCQSLLEVLGSWNPLWFQGSLGSRELGKVERSELSDDLGIVLACLPGREVVGIGQTVSDLFELIHSDFSRLIGALNDVPGDLVGDATLLSASVQLTTMDVSWIKLAWSLETLPRHVSSGDFPGCVVPCSVRLCRSIGQVHAVTELTAGAEPGSSLPLRILLVGLRSSLRFSQNAHNENSIEMST